MNIYNVTLWDNGGYRRTIHATVTYSQAVMILKGIYAWAKENEPTKPEYKNRKRVLWTHDNNMYRIEKVTQ